MIESYFWVRYGTVYNLLDYLLRQDIPENYFAPFCEGSKEMPDLYRPGDQLIIDEMPVMVTESVMAQNMAHYLVERI